MEGIFLSSHKNRRKKNHSQSLKHTFSETQGGVNAIFFRESKENEREREIFFASIAAFLSTHSTHLEKRG
jgi:hypothetical protein